MYRVVFGLVVPVVRLLFRVQVRGAENVPAPPFVIASNHQAWFDTLFVVAAFPGLPMVYTMARRDTVFNRAWKRWFAVRLGAFPIAPSRGELDERGVATVYQLLAAGGVVLIFPEGRYSRGRALRPLKTGVAHFALQAGVPISPVALAGVDRLRSFGRVEVSIGPPVRPDPPGWWSLTPRVERLLETLRQAILGAFGRRPAAEGRWPSRLRRGAAWPFRRRRRLGADGRTSKEDMPPGAS